MAYNIKFTLAELDRFQKRKPNNNEAIKESQQFQHLTPAQRQIVKDAELKLCSYREDKTLNAIVVWYDGFPLLEIPKGLLKDVKDFRDIPRAVEELLERSLITSEVKNK